MLTQPSNFSFYWWAVQRGLSPNEMVYLLLEYINNQDNDDALEDYCKQYAEDDQS